MELPNWVVDDILAPAPPSALRLTVFLYRHGRALVGSDGGRRAYWRGTVPELARLSGMDKKSVIMAQNWLAEAGLLTLHRVRPNSPHSVSVPFDRPAGSGNFPPPSDSQSAHHGDGESRSPTADHDHSITNTTPPPREEVRELFHRLDRLGVTSPAQLVERYGAERCTLALDALNDAAATTDVKNPAGLYVALLRSDRTFAPRPEARDTLSPVARMHRRRLELVRVEGMDWDSSWTRARAEVEAEERDA